MKLVTQEDRIPLEQALARSKRIFLVSTLGFIVVVMGNLFLSPYEYVWNMLGNILLTAAYGCYCVYYLTALYPYRKAKCQIFENWDRGNAIREIVYVRDNSLTVVPRGHLHYYAVNTTILVNTKEMNRQLLLVEPTPLPLGKLVVTTLASVVLEYEVSHEA